MRLSTPKHADSKSNRWAICGRANETARVVFIEGGLSISRIGISSASPLEVGLYEHIDSLPFFCPAKISSPPTNFRTFLICSSFGLSGASENGGGLSKSKQFIIKTIIKFF